MINVGIDDIEIYFPRLFFDIKDLAELRDIEYDKLNRGLGLEAMAIPDTHEDAATMGANAVASIIDRNNIDPNRIGRIYMGTESALDGSKPTATYILDMLEQRYSPEYGEDCLRNCDVVDMTFACIGAVDALHNSLDWVARGGENDDRIGIVVFSDIAKYDMHSSGEYTQGAAGGALLIKQDPRLMVIPDCWGVSTKPVHDFFKPRRTVGFSQLFDNVLTLAKEMGADLPGGLAEKMIKMLPKSKVKDQGIFSHGHKSLNLHKDTPVFDGQYSNRCYSGAIKTAFTSFKEQAIKTGRYNPAQDEIITEQWKRVNMHLPYAFQGKRMFPDIFLCDRRGLPAWQEITEQVGEEPNRENFDDTPEGKEEWHRQMDSFRRMVSQTPHYKKFVEERIEKGQRASSLIGNIYTGSIFLSLMSMLEADLKDGIELSGKPVGMFGYGSGAKAKVFEGVIQPEWKEVTTRFNLFDRMAARRSVDSKCYEELHREARKESVVPPKDEFALVEVGVDGVNEGARSYQWIG